MLLISKEIGSYIPRLLEKKPLTTLKSALSYLVNRDLY